MNTAFPIRNIEHITTLNTRGVSDRGKSHNMLVSGKHDGVWMSNVVPGVKPKEIIIAENPIDALSHRILYPPALPGERVYLSTAGQPGGLQMPTIQKIINQVKPDKVILGFDNDFAGIRFNIQMMGELHLPQQGNSPWKAYLTAGNQVTNETNQLRLSLGQGREIPPGQYPADLVKRMETVLNAGHQVEETKAKIKLGKTYSGDVEIIASIPNNRPMLIRAENLVKEVRGTGEFMVVKRSVEKDFNDDLKVVVKDRLAQEEKIRQGRPENRRNDPIVQQPEWLTNLQKKLQADKALRQANAPKVEVGPTGLVMHNYAKGEVKNELPDDGAKRVRKENAPDGGQSPPKQTTGQPAAPQQPYPPSSPSAKTNEVKPEATYKPISKPLPAGTGPGPAPINPRASLNQTPPTAPNRAAVAEGAFKPGEAQSIPKSTTKNETKNEIKNETKNETKNKASAQQAENLKKAVVPANATRIRR